MAVSWLNSRHDDEHAMKKITIIGLRAAIVIACILLLWFQTKISNDRDEALREKLPGVWFQVRLPQNMRYTNTIAADGSFVELAWFSHPHGTNTYQRTGTWLVKNEHLIRTVESSTNPREVTPRTNSARIVRADAHGFTVRWQDSREAEWKRIIQ